MRIERRTRIFFLLAGLTLGIALLTIGLSGLRSHAAATPIAIPAADTTPAVPAAAVSGPLLTPGAPGDEVAYTPPASNRLKFNFDYDWKFIKQDVKGADSVTFDDKAWTDVSLPHTFNDVDSFVEWRSHDAKDGPIPNPIRFFEGKVWYRKHFTLDAAWAGRKVFLEFEGVRNTGVFYVNGTNVGTHSNQVGPCGLDVTDVVKFGADNIIAVQVDSNMLAKDPAGYSYSWSAEAFYSKMGGLVKDANLYITDKLYQTLPLYSNLKTSGVYAYNQHIDTLNRTSDFTVESEVANEYADAKSAVFDAWIVDRDGNIITKQTSNLQSIPAGGKYTFKLSAPLTGLHFWSPDYPYLYRVYTSLTLDGKIVDICKTPMGVRKVTFNTTDGLKINGHMIYLKGYAPRTVMEWAVAGTPQDWMTEYDYKLMKEDNGNFIRPMHVAPRRHQVDSADKFGIIMTCPAGDGEGDDPADAQGIARWEDREGVERDVMIAFRNNPSVVFYEASNSGITLQHMKDMIDIRNQWDPYGGRYCGTRSTDNVSISVREYQSPMDTPNNSTLMPSWDAEYARAEAPRRVWDKYTPFLNQQGTFVTGGYLAAASKVHVDGTAAGTMDGIYAYPADEFRLMSTEDLALNNAFKYWDRYSRSAFVESPADRKTKGVMVGGAKIIFADSFSDARMRDMEVARVTGLIDGARLPKQSYYALQVCQNTQPEVFILDHWNYTAGFHKPVWVISNTEKVKLVSYDENGKVIKEYGWGTQDVTPQGVNHYVYKFKDVEWFPGKLEAVGYNGDTEVARHALVTAGPAVALRLTAVPAPDKWRADGADIAMVDVEVVDANGVRVPTDEARVDFTHSGAGQFMGGYNSGIRGSTFKDNLNTECGINRVFVRSTRTAGDFKLTVSRKGLTDATITLTSVAVDDKNGLSTVFPRRYGYTLGAEPDFIADPTEPATRAVGTGSTVPVPTAGPDVMREFAYTGTNGATLTPPLPLAHIEHNAKDGAQIYVDKPWTFAGLPAYLVGGDYVQAFERDAPEGSSTDTVQFYTNQSCYVYLVVDAANGMPNNNNNADYKWQKQPDKLTINGRTCDIYKSRLLPEGYNGYFASNGHGITVVEGSLQYVAFAVAAK